MAAQHVDAVALLRGDQDRRPQLGEVPGVGAHGHLRDELGAHAGEAEQRDRVRAAVGDEGVVLVRGELSGKVGVAARWRGPLPRLKGISPAGSMWPVCTCR